MVRAPAGMVKLMPREIRGRLKPAGATPRKRAAHVRAQENIGSDAGAKRNSNASKKRTGGKLDETEQRQPVRKDNGEI